MRRSSSINPHVRMFAIALATIVAAFTLVSPAKAEIVYHSANIGINLGTYNLDLNGDGVTDFTITSAWSGRCAFGSDASFELTETPASGNGAVLGPLKLGNEIGPNQSFDGNEGVMSGYRLVFSIRLHKCVIEILDWPWLGKTGYLGLSLQVNGQTYYGWALLHSPKPGGSGTFLGYAYETIAGRAILAGETSYVWFTPASLNFGTVTLGDTASGSVSLTNLGTTTLLITKATIGGRNSSDFSSKNGNPPCGGSVAAGATCTLTFTFTPSLVGKEKAAYFVYDDGGASPQELKLIGTGQ